MDKKSTSLVYGLIIGVIMAVFQIIFHLTGLAYKSSTAWYEYLAYIPYIAGVIMNAISFSKANDGYVTFGKVFGDCFKLCMIATLVLVVWNVAAIYVFPDMKEKALDLAHQKMQESNKNLTDEQMDMALNMTRKYYSAFLIFGIIFGSLLYGAIFSLIGAGIAQKKGNPPIVATNF